jgi:NAD(P)-dependent dehydrogenase (short-subunit alcohol dehydrogenase family)
VSGDEETGEETPVAWTLRDVPDLEGRTVLVTGATSGLGEVTAVVAATRGAEVVLATRDADRTRMLVDRVHERQPAASFEHLPLDLADLDQVREAGARFLDRHDRLDVLVNNAGVMNTPLRRTAQGFELQVGVNHLGHHALTGHLLPALVATPGARVVTVSSFMHRGAVLDPDTLGEVEEPYDRWAAYRRSKLANLLFTSDLQRRFVAAGVDTSAVAAHPGYAATALQTRGPGMDTGLRRVVGLAGTRLANLLLAQPATTGALPQLRAAFDPAVEGDSYWGPTGFRETRGDPGPVGRSDDARDPELARRVGLASEDRTGVALEVPAR